MTVVTAQIVMVVVKQELAALTQVVLWQPKQIALLRVVPTTVTVQLATATLVVVVAVAKKDTLQTVWVLALKMPCTPTGLVMGTAMMVHTFLRIMAMVVPQVLLSISTAMSLIVMVVTANVTMAQLALAAWVANVKK